MSDHIGPGIRYRHQGPRGGSAGPAQSLLIGASNGVELTSGSGEGVLVTPAVAVAVADGVKDGVRVAGSAWETSPSPQAVAGLSGIHP